MKICIITDDNAGFTKEEIKELGIKVIRMPVLIDGEEFFENETITNEEFYKKLEGGSDIKTSQPSPGEVLKLWDETLKSYDAIVHIPMSSGLSESCNTASMLANDYEGKVFVVNNHRISVTLKTSIRDALKMVKEGKSPQEIKDYLEQDAFNSTIYIMVDTLKYLVKGGRVTPAAALIGGALHIKPILTILGEKLDAYKKVVGTKKGKLALINAIKSDLEDKFKDTSKEDLCFQMAYTFDLESALAFKKEFADSLGIDESQIELNPLSLSVATHIGPGSLAVTVSHIYNH